MEVEIIQGPGNAVARLQLANGEAWTAQAGAMMAMSDNVTITTTTHKRGGGSFWKAVKRMFAGGSFFLNHFTTQADSGEVWVTATLSGDMMVYSLEQENLIVQNSAFIACEEDVELDLGWQGFKSILSGESVFWLHLKGRGKVVLAAFGAIYPVDINGEYIVDTGHIVAFNETLNFSITKAGKSWLSSFLSGEALVCKFQGRGRVWCQSHNPASFGKTLSVVYKKKDGSLTFSNGGEYV